MAGIKYWRGKPLLFRDSHAANNSFGLGNAYLNSVPRPKFMFFVRFMRSTGTTSSSNSASSSLNWSKGVSFVVKSMDRPRIRYDVETLNQYNKKRVIQKKVEYDDIILRFHDTVDNKAVILHDDYNKFYYSDSRSLSVTNWSADQTAGKMTPAVGGRWGYNPLPRQDNPNYAQYFSHIEVYQVYGGYYNMFCLVNPKIRSWDADEMTYTDGSLTHEISMHLDYEGILYQSYGTKLTAGLIQEMGLDRTSFFEPENGPVGTILGLTNILYPYGTGSSNSTSSILGGLNLPTQIPTVNSILGSIVGSSIGGLLTGSNAGSSVRTGFLSSFGVFDYDQPKTTSFADLTNFQTSGYNNLLSGIQIGTKT